jgi:hypothetical protein
MQRVVGNLKERDSLEDLGIDDRIILKWVSKMLVGRAWTGLMWRRIETSDGVL